MRKPALVPRVDNNAMPTLHDCPRKHADTMIEHDGGMRPTARHRSRTQATAPTGVLRSANPLIQKAPNAPNAPNAKMQGDSFASAAGGALDPARDRVA
ncbi:hypothetical protein [Reyranella sp.]|uniref:hypothetical protein n=1 Tax=Reyranella sp. TaxID=1929291 RepID=UPI0037832F9F